MPEQNISILLIEDNPGDVGLIKEYLNESTEIHFLLTSAATLKDGLLLASEINFDIFLLDLSLPDSKGLKTLSKVRNAHPDKPVIVLTGNIDLSVSKQAIQAGAQDFLVKGKIDNDLLIRSITYAIQRSQLETKIIEYSERLKKAQEVGHTGSWELDLITSTNWGSEEAYKIYGLPVKSFYPLEEIQALVVPEYRTALQDEISRQVEKDNRYNVIFPIRRPADGELRWINSAAEIIRDISGKPLKAMGVVRDITEAKEAEEKIKTSERLYKLIADNSLDVIWTMDLDGQFTYVSPSIYKLCGFTPEEVMSTSLSALIAPDSFLFVMNELSNGLQILHTNTDFEPVVLEVEFNCKPGGTVWTEIVADKLSDENGKVIGILGITREIKERKRIQDELKSSERRFWDMFNNAPFGYHELDKDGKIVQVNKTELDLLQYTREEMIGSYVWNFLSDGESSQERVLGKLRGEIPPGRGTERRYQRKDGEIITLLVEDRLIHNPEGKITGLRSALQNITDRKKTENELLKLSLAVEQSPASIVITDISGSIEYVNRTFTTTTGYTTEEALHKNPRILKSGHMTKEEYKVLWDTILSGKNWFGEFLNVKKSGDLYWEEAIISPIKNKDGEIINFLAIKRDVTDLKKINEELREAKETAEEMNRLKSSFLANMSHELRTPMIGILGYSEMLLEEFPDEKVHEIGGIILQSGHRLMETLNLILDLSRIEAKKLDVKVVPVDIVPVAREIATLFNSAADKKQLYLKVDSTCDALELLLDEKMFREILNNLINNAIKFTKQGGVTVTIGKDSLDNAEWAIIRVTDTGIGIASENFNMIFEEFRQASEGQSRSFEGTGLGLTITKRFVEKLNGIISVDSTVGKGTTFTVRFPIQPLNKIKTDDVHTSIQGAAQAKTVLPQVLYVEDDEIAVHIVSKMLDGYCEIDTTNNAEAALHMAQAKKYDAVFMDINLGKGLDGVQTTRRLKGMDIYKDIPIVAMTAYAMVGDKEEFLNAGCTHYISKPFTKSELLKVASEVLPTIK